MGSSRDPPSENRGIRGVKIRVVNKRKSGPALERGQDNLEGRVVSLGLCMRNYPE